MSAFRSIVNELETALQSGSIARRTELLRRVTDLFLGGAASYSTEQISLFDDVMARLITDIEVRVLTELSSRLASNAPAKLIQQLANDDHVSVSGPVLKEDVTDVLVDRGDAQVATEVASNLGTRFSKAGFSKPAMRANADDVLTGTIACRPDLPPLLLRHVLARATDAARQRLLKSAQPAVRHPIREILNHVSRQMRSSLTPPQYAHAKRVVSRICQDTALSTVELWEFATTHRLAEAIVALSVLSAVPIDLVDYLVNNSSPFGALVVCKAVALDWIGTQAIIQARLGANKAALVDTESLKAEYQDLSTPSAQRLLRFWQARQDQLHVTMRKPGSALAAH